MYVRLPRFYETFFGSVAGLEAASEAVFKKCVEGDNPLFSAGWRGWRKDANQDDVLNWFAELSDKLAAFGEDYNPTPGGRRRPLAQPNQPIQGSAGERKMDIGFVNDPGAGKDSRCYWSQILVPGELKSDLSAESLRLSLHPLRTSHEDMEFDRLGGIASEQFGINVDGLQFVSTILGFLWMDEERLVSIPPSPRRTDNAGSRSNGTASQSASSSTSS